MKGASGTVGVAGRKRSSMASVQRQKEIERFSATDLAQQYSIGPHSKCIADQIPDRDLSNAFTVGRSGLELHDVDSMQLKFRGVFDDNNAFVFVEEITKGTKQRCLPAASSTADHDVAPVDDKPRQQSDKLRWTKRCQRQRPRSEATNGDDRAIDRQRRNHNVDPAAVGQTSIDQGVEPVDPQTEGIEDSFDSNATSVASRRRPAGSSPRLPSSQTSPGPLIMISVTSGSTSTSAMGPRPFARCHARSTKS